jgi:hypothetical protein
VRPDPVGAFRFLGLSSPASATYSQIIFAVTL